MPIYLKAPSSNLLFKACKEMELRLEAHTPIASAFMDQYTTKYGEPSAINHLISNDTTDARQHFYLFKNMTLVRGINNEDVIKFKFSCTRQKIPLV